MIVQILFSGPIFNDIKIEKGRTLIGETKPNMLFGKIKVYQFTRNRENSWILALRR